MSGMIIYLERLLPAVSSDPPENESGKSICSLFGLASDGVYMATVVTNNTVVSYTAFPPLPHKVAVYFCCTILGVTSTGRYPASCPMKPGLSSPANRQPRSFILLLYLLIINYTSKQLPPTNSLQIELFGNLSLLTPRKYSKNLRSLLASKYSASPGSML